MIEASFDRSSRSAAVSGVYQYDTGQRLRMNGLPSPDELAAADDFLIGDLVTVQVHYGYVGDAQTESRLAVWDEDSYCWIANIPDEYLTKNEPVSVYVYIYHGEDENGSRAQTMYEGVFTPTYRPAPNNIATDDMLDRWAELSAEVELALSSASASLESVAGYTDDANAAAKEALAASKTANTAATSAKEAVNRLKDIEREWSELKVTTSVLAAGATATVAMKDGVLTYGIPKGATGEAGEKGDTGDTGPSDISLSITSGVLTILPK